MNHTTEGQLGEVSNTILSDISERGTGLTKPRMEALSNLISCALYTQSCNSYEWINVLPRAIQDASKESYIYRFLSNKKVDVSKVMRSYILDIVENNCSSGETLILMIDQSKICANHEVLMVSISVGERALPLLWLVKNTKGSIGFADQKQLLDKITLLLPDDIKVLLAGDRFYGTSALVNWCKKQGWQYRIRLKGNLIFKHEGGEITGNYAADMQLKCLKNVTFNSTDINTNIGILHEKGHKEAWIIAMDCQPNKYKVLDYALRWGIEPMFSDFKSRGFSITDTKYSNEKSLESLILVLSLAMYWAVSTGMYGSADGENLVQQSNKTVKKLRRSALSFFKKGLRIIRRIFLNAREIMPCLWKKWRTDTLREAFL